MGEKLLYRTHLNTPPASGRTPRISRTEGGYPPRRCSVSPRTALSPPTRFLTRRCRRGTSVELRGRAPSAYRSGSSTPRVRTPRRRSA
eukprot:30799-Pelagococcus_subviridis.AAC.8